MAASRPLLWVRQETPGRWRGLSCGGNSGVGVRGRTSCSVWPGVSVKTFSTHVAVVFRLIVSGKRFSAHERVWGNRRKNRAKRESRETEDAGKTGKFEKNRGNRVNEGNQRKQSKRGLRANREKGSIEITEKRDNEMGRLECGREKEITDISGDNRGNRRKRGRCGIAGSSLGSYYCPLFFECYYINCELTERQFGTPTGQRRQ